MHCRGGAITSLFDDQNIPSDVSAEVEDLRRRINHANYLYYVKDQPDIADDEYDRLMRRLQEIEAKYPQLVTPDSPTQRVGIAPQAALGTFVHAAPMLSLANAFGEDELRAFDERCHRFLSLEQSEDIEYI